MTRLSVLLETLNCNLMSHKILDLSFVTRIPSHGGDQRLRVDWKLITPIDSGEYLKNDPDAQLPLAVVTQTDEITDQIIDLAGNPKLTGHWKRRGMVIGHVQSGKTLNYSSVINKVADAGYRIIILLAGLTNSLRRQTQDRIDHAFIGVQSSDANVISNLIGSATYAPRPPIRQPNYFTSLENDFLKSSAWQPRVCK